MVRAGRIELARCTEHGHLGHVLYGLNIYIMSTDFVIEWEFKDQNSVGLLVLTDTRI
jgi:hypothetical protein